MHPQIGQCDSHRPDKVNYSIHCPNTRATRQHVEESLNFAIHGVAHATSVLEIDCLASKLYVAILPPNLAKRCWTLQAIIGTMCSAKVGIGKHNTFASTYKGLMKEFHFPNNGEYEFWFCPDDIKCCVCGNMKNVLNWPIVPNTWPVKISTNISKEEVVAFEDVGFQLQQRGTLSPRCRFLTITTFSIPSSHFYMPSNLVAHPTFKFGKTVCRNPTAPLRITKTNRRTLDS